MDTIANFNIVQNPADMDMGLSVYFDCTQDNTRISLHAVPNTSPMTYTGVGRAQILPDFTTAPPYGGWIIDRGLHQFSWYPYDDLGNFIGNVALSDIYLQWHEGGVLAPGSPLFFNAVRFA